MENIEEFEPFCKWHKEEGRDILDVHLHGFRREHLKVHITSSGFLIISGERQLDETTKQCFQRQIKVSKDYKANENIRAKFSGGILYITLPKKVTWLSTLISTNEEKIAANTSLLLSFSNPAKYVHGLMALKVTVGVAMVVALAAYVYQYF